MDDAALPVLGLLSDVLLPGEARMLPLVRWMMAVAEDYPRDRRNSADGITPFLSRVAPRAHGRSRC